VMSKALVVFNFRNLLDILKKLYQIKVNSLF
jgi:hypothetical protein